MWGTKAPYLFCRFLSTEFCLISDVRYSVISPRKASQKSGFLITALTVICLGSNKSVLITLMKTTYACIGAWEWLKVD